MPKYTFVCDTCVVEFERTLKMGEHPHHACPSCKENAPRVFEEQSVAFGFAESPKAAPANTGVHKEDYPTADHIVGKDANKRWGEYHERERAKNQARAHGGTHALIRATADQHIDYTPMSVNGLNARRGLAKDTYEKVRQAKTARGR